MAHILGGPNILKGYVREWQAGNPVLSFTPEELQAGCSLLERMGIYQADSFICFGLREQAYYRQFLMSGPRQRRVNSEAEPDTYVRNPPLENYLPMAQRCAQAGLYVLRMGQSVGETLPAGLPSNIIDYASKHRSPFGDIYLLAHCKFLVTGGAGGLWWIAAAFNHPVVMTDSYCIQVRPLRRGDLFVPKKLWHLSDKRFLSFREMLATGMRYSYEGNCRRDGIELVHNTPEEIAAVVEEMNQRLEGTWQADEEDDDLQRRFNALYLPEHYGYGLPGQIGAKFLRDHKDLLE
jgi:putative glycosyltransferase (TIGR04372 family)